jgi:anti-sigma B factor antagonist
MDFSATEHDNIVVVTVRNAINQDQIALFKTRLQEIIAQGHVWIVLDMSTADYLSSMGVALIVDVKRRTSSSGGDLKLACVNKLTQNLLDYTQVNRKIEIFETVDGAVAALKSLMAQGQRVVSMSNEFEDNEA